MGIAGLLPQLKSITKRKNITAYNGKRVAVDGYCLLHKGAYCCAREIVEGEPADKCVQYCMGRVELLLGAGVTPVIVLDGGNLPGKQGEERARKRARQENRERARALWEQGNRGAACECYQRAVDITPAVAKQFVEALKRRGVEFIVAPYEADAQMAYLAHNGSVDAVLTEDSDLITYNCPTVLLKMDKTGNLDEIQVSELARCRELPFAGWTHDLFVQMCVMAGCDFVASIPGIGIKKAHQHIKRTRSFVKAVRMLRFDGVAVPPGYEASVQRAVWTFRHQRVYCPQHRAVVHLTDLPEGGLATGAMVPAAAELAEGEADFLGPPLPDHVAQGIAEGDLDPVTKRPFGELFPAAAPAGRPSHAAGSSSQQRRAPPPPPRSSGQLSLANMWGRPPAGGASAGAASASSHQHDGPLPGATRSAMQEFKRPRLHQPAGRGGGGGGGAGAAAWMHAAAGARAGQPAPQAAAWPGGLLATLRATLQQDEPKLEEVLAAGGACRPEGSGEDGAGAGRSCGSSPRGGGSLDPCPSLSLSLGGGTQPGASQPSWQPRRAELAGGSRSPDPGPCELLVEEAAAAALPWERRQADAALSPEFVAGVTPGFYTAGLPSTDECSARRRTPLRRMLGAAEPGSTGSGRRPAGRLRAEPADDEVESPRCSNATAAAVAAAAAADGRSPISSLRHLPACEREAAAVVGAAQRAAEREAEEFGFGAPPAPAPVYLQRQQQQQWERQQQQQGSGGSPGQPSRPLLASTRQPFQLPRVRPAAAEAADQENRRQALLSKLASKSAGTGQRAGDGRAAPGAAPSIFGKFTCPAKKQPPPRA